MKMRGGRDDDIDVEPFGTVHHFRAFESIGKRGGLSDDFDNGDVKHVIGADSFRGGTRKTLALVSVIEGFFLRLQTREKRAALADRFLLGVGGEGMTAHAECAREVQDRGLLSFVGLGRFEAAAVDDADFRDAL